MPILTLEFLSEWLQRYMDAWRSNDATEVSQLFSVDAIYYYGPFRAPARGREAIVASWLAIPERQEDLVLRFEPVAVDGELGIAHWRASYTKDSGRRKIELDGILMLRFNSVLECTEHREWYERREKEFET